MPKAPRLQRGDTIGIVSPSWGGAGVFPHRVAQGVRQLESLGFKVKLAPHALEHRGFTSDTPENRVADLHALFRDSEVKAIVAAIGGDHACHLLPLLDFDLVRRQPKIVMGYSDMTVLNVALWHTVGLVTFNGPALLTDFGEYPRMLEYTQRYFLKAVAEARPIGEIAPAAEWTEEFQDWAEKKDLERPRTLQPSEGWTWLRAGHGTGRLVGGALESLQHLRGTPYWPDWRDAIFFFETTEEKPSPETVDGILMDYQNMGVLEQLQGLIVGRAMAYTPAEKQRLRERILERTQRYDFPIVTDLDFGHTAPQFTLPIGCQARVDGDRHVFEILEPAVEL
jgi:muramoyltetrapeptide carboxypeptidase LdcA involved in peptidoglycan recycling